MYEKEMKKTDERWLGNGGGGREGGGGGGREVEMKGVMCNGDWSTAVILSAVFPVQKFYCFYLTEIVSNSTFFLFLLSKFLLFIKQKKKKKEKSNSF